MTSTQSSDSWFGYKIAGAITAVGLAAVGLYSLYSDATDTTKRKKKPRHFKAKSQFPLKGHSISPEHDEKFRQQILESYTQLKDTADIYDPQHQEILREIRMMTPNDWATTTQLLAGKWLYDYQDYNYLVSSNIRGQPMPLTVRNDYERIWKLLSCQYTTDSEIQMKLLNVALTLHSPAKLLSSYHTIITQEVEPNYTETLFQISAIIGEWKHALRLGATVLLTVPSSITVDQHLDVSHINYQALYSLLQSECSLPSRPPSLAWWTCEIQSVHFLSKSVNDTAPVEVKEMLDTFPAEFTFEESRPFVRSGAVVQFYSIFSADPILITGYMLDADSFIGCGSQYTRDEFSGSETKHQQRYEMKRVRLEDEKGISIWTGTFNIVSEQTKGALVMENGSQLSDESKPVRIWCEMELKLHRLDSFTDLSSSSADSSDSPRTVEADEEFSER